MPRNDRVSKAREELFDSDHGWQEQSDFKWFVEKIHGESQPLRLNHEQSRVLIESLPVPKPPNRALRRAAKEHRKRVSN